MKLKRKIKGAFGRMIPRGFHEITWKSGTVVELDHELYTTEREIKRGMNNLKTNRHESITKNSKGQGSN